MSSKEKRRIKKVFFLFAIVSGTGRRGFFANDVISVQLTRIFLFEGLLKKRLNVAMMSARTLMRNDLGRFVCIVSVFMGRWNRRTGFSGFSYNFFFRPKISPQE